MVLAGFLLLINFFAWQEVFAFAGPHYLKVDVLDVGQGDSIFIETPARRRIIIDGGPDSAVLGKLAERLPVWEKSLDVVMLTHPDADHVAGVLQVLERYKVDYIVWTGMVRDGANYQKWVELLAKKHQEGSNIIIAKAGTKITSGGATIDTLHPFENLEGQFFGKQGNDTGIVSRLSYGKKSFLLAADISSKAEQAMVKAGLSLASDVLKVAHHGSKYSSSEVFLQAIKPAVAVISAGAKNSYGHPTSEVLQNLFKFGIKVLRTDQDKDVEFLSDGNTIKILAP